VLDPATRSFLSPDPLDHVPGMPGAGNPYQYAWNDPVGMLDPTGLRPLSDADYQYSQAGMFGQAWDNIRQDPWGDLAAAGVIALGVGLMFVPGGQVIGAGILLGAATSAGLGLVTGNLNSRSIAISGAVGAIGGGVGAALTKAGVSALTSNAVSSGAQDLLTQELAHPGHLDTGELAFSTAAGGLGGAGGLLLRQGANTGSSDGIRTFYSVQGPEDAARLLHNGGKPWPTGSGPSGSERALLGPGLYAWDTSSQAEAYSQGLASRGATDLQIIQHSVPESVLNSFRSADMTSMTDDAANALLDSSPDHGFQWVRRMTGRYGPENYFSPDVFPLFSNLPG
jgi:hypothetical protein